MHVTAFAVVAMILASTAVWAGPVSTDPQPGKVIVFLAGPKDHGWPGRHEYEKTARVLAACLEQSPGLKGITTKVFVGKAPQNFNELADASVIVINSSSDRDARETHPLFPPDPTTNHNRYDPETTAYLKQVDGLTKKGTGVVVFHYALWAENFAAREYYANWLGGLWVQIPSRNPNDTWSMTLRNETHPILRGVKPWSYTEEIFTRFFLWDDPRRTDLLVGTPTGRAKALGPQVAAWAYQRDDGGRGFAFGGVDFHKNLLIEDHRRFLLNGIIWAAGMEVPEGGVISTVPEELMK